MQGRYQSKTCATKKDARAWAAAVEAQLERAVASGPETVGDALTRYAHDVSPTKKGARWEQIRLTLLQRYPLADIPLARLTAEDVAAWRDRRGGEVAAASVNRELNLLSAVFERARREWRWMTANPVREIARPKNPRPRDRRISADEIERVTLALGYEAGHPAVTAQQQTAVAFLLALETAMRLGELMGLAWEHVHLERRHLVIQDTKNGERRAVALSQRAVTLFGALDPKSAGPVFRCTGAVASTLFRRAVARAEIEGLRFHDSRHHAITDLARKLDVLDLARMVGHRDIKSLMIYFNATAEEIAGRLDGD